MGFSRQEYWSGVPSPFSSVQFTSVQSLSCVRLFAAEDDQGDVIYHKFMSETLDEAGHLKAVQFHYPENYNFGFDVVDAIAAKDPDRLAMVWVSNKHECRKFTYRDISRYSNKTANYLTSLGIKKGDFVMLVLKRHYQFWFSMVALHKIGAIAVPATNQLQADSLRPRGL